MGINDYAGGAVNPARRTLVLYTGGIVSLICRYRYNVINAQCAPDTRLCHFCSARRWRTGQQPAGKSLPIVDEVLVHRPYLLGMLAAIEVAGEALVETLQPYGIATVFNLNADETKNIVPMARALIGNRSAVG